MSKTEEGVYEGGTYRANFTPLTPLSFLPRAAHVYPTRTALIYGDLRQSWSQTYDRCRRLASALQGRAIGRGDIVAIIAPNTPEMYEAHFGIPMAGAIINTLNTRLKADEIAFQLKHSGARAILVDSEFGATVASAVESLSPRPLIIHIGAPGSATSFAAAGDVDYEMLLNEGDPDFDWQLPDDEMDAIALNYTSGTTGNPKGVVTHHRGAHLNALAQIIAASMPQNPVYLWTLPMFHCNGWCFPWAIAAQGGTNVCLRRVDAPVVLDLMQTHGVTHLCGAPIVYSMLIDELHRNDRALSQRATAMVAGAAPPRAMFEAGERLGLDFLHTYGLTEVYGPAAVCPQQPEWSPLPIADRAKLNARQGAAMVSQEVMSVLDPVTMLPVPHDGQTVGEIMFRGNATMSGYLKDREATEKAFAGGWFHTGDLAVVDTDGYARITDRSKDVIISGGENISSLEIEDILHRHPAVLLAAVVAKPDARWGEVPCAFIELRDGNDTTAADLSSYCRSLMAGFKVPKLFRFGPLPKTSTGKVQKVALRAIAKDLS